MSPTQRKPSVAFAYGASTRLTGGHERDIRDHFDLERDELLIINWGNIAAPPAHFETYLASRFDKTIEPHVEEYQAVVAATDAAAGEAAAMINPIEIMKDLGGALLERGADAAPVWLKREILRSVWGGIAKSGPTIWDAVHYLANGKPLTDRAETMLAEWKAPRPRIVIGLSLGGIVLVDALSRFTRRGEKPVDLLITVGSQSPLIHLCGGLELDRDGDARPFTPWLNIWNPDDFLSYPAEDVFVNVPDIVDGRVETPKMVFPDCHSAYFRPGAPGWAFIDDAIAALRPS